MVCKLNLWSCALRKSRLISHRDNVNPFGASFLNYVTALKLTEVTIDATTFVEMEGSFETDLLVRGLRRVFFAPGCELLGCSVVLVDVR